MDLRNIKHKIILSVKESGPSTQKNLSSRLDMHVTALSKAINELVFQDRLLVEKGKDLSYGGRRSRLYHLNKDIGYIVGIDIGGANIRVILIDISGNILIQTKEQTSQSGGDKVFQQTIGLLNKTMQKINISYNDIIGVGVGISGCIDANSGSISFCPNIKGLENFPFKEKLEDEINKPVVFDDSVRCMALAEKKYGCAKDFNNFIFVSLGIGIGAGIFINNSIYRGSKKSKGFTGEIGHITVSEAGPRCKCGNKGCLEVLASGPSIINRALDGIKNNIITSLTKFSENNYSGLTVEKIIEEASTGDKFSYYIINRTGEYIGMAIADAVNLFGGDQIIIGGGISNSGEILLDAVKRTVQMRALAIISKNIQISKSTLDDNSAALGAGANFIDYLFSEKSEYLLNINSIKKEII